MLSLVTDGFYCPRVPGTGSGGPSTVLNTPGFAPGAPVVAGLDPSGSDVEFSAVAPQSPTAESIRPDAPTTQSVQNPSAPEVADDLVPRITGVKEE